MRELVYVMIFIFAMMSCQTETPAGNEIVFGDVIGNYDGECADYISSASELMNREDATLSVFAASTKAAGINTSCDRFMDQNLPVKSASASKIVFEMLNANSMITMTYFAEHDSITIIDIQDGKNENLIFTGKRN